MLFFSGKVNIIFSSLSFIILLCNVRCQCFIELFTNCPPLGSFNAQPQNSVSWYHQFILWINLILSIYSECFGTFIEHWMVDTSMDPLAHTLSRHATSDWTVETLSQGFDMDTARGNLVDSKLGSAMQSARCERLQVLRLVVRQLPVADVVNAGAANVHSRESFIVWSRVRILEVTSKVAG